MTIEECMRLADAYQASAGNRSMRPRAALRAALTALVAQARDEEAEACAGIVMAEQATPHGLAYCEAAIRARIAARKEQSND